MNVLSSLEKKPRKPESHLGGGRPPGKGNNPKGKFFFISTRCRLLKESNRQHFYDVSTFITFFQLFIAHQNLQFLRPAKSSTTWLHIPKDLAQKSTPHLPNVLWPLLLPSLISLVPLPSHFQLTDFYKAFRTYRGHYPESLGYNEYICLLNYFYIHDTSHIKLCIAAVCIYMAYVLY